MKEKFLPDELVYIKFVSKKILKILNLYVTLKHTNKSSSDTLLQWMRQIEYFQKAKSSILNFLLTNLVISNFACPRLLLILLYYILSIFRFTL